jgi:undecaprenyl-diphosphatase
MPSQRFSPRRARSRRHESASRRRPSLCQAAALGALQGPTELLPVSSSAHTTLIPWLAGWSSYAELDPELRKSLEVALHAGAAAALAIDMRTELIEAARTLDRRRAGMVALSLAPPALAGYALQGPIERHLGGPRSITVGLIAGAAAMALADLRPGRLRGRRAPDGRGVRDGSPARGGRRVQEAGPRDGLALGLAQAMALIPGVSRSGATLTAARARGFARADAQALSWHAGLGVILGASALQAWRMRRRGLPDEARPALAAGAGGAFVSTLASAHVLRRPRVSSRSLLPYAVYRCTIAVVALKHLRDAQNRSG